MSPKGFVAGIQQGQAAIVAIRSRWSLPAPSSVTWRYHLDSGARANVAGTAERWQRIIRVIVRRHRRADEMGVRYFPPPTRDPTPQS